MMKNIAYLIIGLLINTINVFSQSTKEAQLTNNSSDDRYASYSPSGEQIIFESNREGLWDIYTMDSDGKNQVSIVSSEFEDRRPSWHPNGKSIVFESTRSGKNEFYEFHFDTGEINKLDIEGIEGTPSFARYSSTGKKIAFTIEISDQVLNIAVSDLNEKSTVLITDYNFRSFYPDWSADGKSILFSSRHETNNGDDEIYRINIDGTGKERLTHWPKHNFCPRWSNDGSKIAYVTSMEDTRPEIYIMAANGEDQIRITNNINGDTLPNWSPDDKKLLVTGYRNGNYEICELTLPFQ